MDILFSFEDELDNDFDFDFDSDMNVFELIEKLVLWVCSVSGVFFFYSLYDFCVVFFFLDRICVILFRSVYRRLFDENLLEGLWFVLKRCVCSDVIFLVNSLDVFFYVVKVLLLLYIDFEQIDGIIEFEDVFGVF